MIGFIFFQNTKSSPIDLIPPFSEDIHNQINSWKVFGNGAFREKEIIISPNIVRSRGSLWSNYVNFPYSMILHAHLKITVDKDYQDNLFKKIDTGFAFWYTSTPKVNHPLNQDFVGGSNNFRGICFAGLFDFSADSGVFIKFYKLENNKTRTYLYDDLKSIEPVATILINDSTKFFDIHVGFDNGNLEFFIDQESLGTISINKFQTTNEHYFIGFSASSGLSGTGLSLLSLKFDQYPGPGLISNKQQNYLEEIQANNQTNQINWHNADSNNDYFIENDNNDQSIDNDNNLEINNNHNLFGKSKSQINNSFPLYYHDFKFNEINLKNRYKFNANLSDYAVKSIIKFKPDIVFEPIIECIKFSYQIPTRNELVRLIGMNMTTFGAKILKRAYKIDRILSNVSGKVNSIYDVSEKLISQFKNNIHDTLLKMKSEAEQINNSFSEVQNTIISQKEIESLSVSPFFKVLIIVSFIEVFILLSLLINPNKERNIKDILFRNYKALF